MRVDTGRLRVVAGDALEPASAEDGGPPSPGAYIREHRMRRGLSLEELAIATKVPRTSLELIEEDRFDELPGMVFAKGFLRCCARALALDEHTVLGLLYELERDARRTPKETTGSFPVARRVTARTGARSARSTLSSLSGGRPAAKGNPPPRSGAKTGVASGAESTGKSGPLNAAGGRAGGGGVGTAGASGEGLFAELWAKIPVPELRLRIPVWFETLRDRLSMSRLLLWVLVSLFVVLVVFLAFTMASSQGGGSTPRI